MKKIFKEDLPKRNNNLSQNVDWVKSVGSIVRFIYYDIVGCVEILSFYRNRGGSSGNLKIKYDGNDYPIKTGAFMDCKLGVILGKFNREYLYSVGDIVEDVYYGKIKIVERIKIKNIRNENMRSYKYECLNCGNIDVLKEYALKNKSGCNICCHNPRKVVIGINDIHTTHPDFGKLLWDYKDGLSHTIGSEKKLDFKCPECKNKVKNKSIKMVHRNKLSCPKCSDGISYPEKIVYNVLKQLNVKFEYQKNFGWAKGKRYDFYIPCFNCIVETHGEQHYKEKGRISRPLEYEQDNDKLKLKLSNGHIDYYFIIDCSNSELEHIKENILTSGLSELIPFNNIDWLKVGLDSNKSLLKIACNMFRDCHDSTVSTIAKVMGLHSSTIRKYLVRGTTLDLCKYDPKEEKKKSSTKNCKARTKQVIQFTLEGDYIESFNSIRDASNKLNIDPSSISSVCHKKYGFKTAGGFGWMFTLDYERRVESLAV